MSDYAAYLLTVTIADYRAIRKAVALLCRVGIDRDNAVALVLDAHQKRNNRYQDYSIPAKR